MLSKIKNLYLKISRKYRIKKAYEPDINGRYEFVYLDKVTYKEYSNLKDIYKIIAIKSNFSIDKVEEYYNLWLEALLWNIIHDFKLKSDTLIFEDKFTYYTEEQFNQKAKLLEETMINKLKDIVRHNRIRE